jgi:hypothetical protein
VNRDCFRDGFVCIHRNGLACNLLLSFESCFYNHRFLM